jgi:hypothetical protein
MNKRKRVPNGFWDDIDNVRLYLEKVIEKVGRFPTQKEMFKLGHGSLPNAVLTHYGSVYNARRDFGFKETENKPFGYWKEWGNVESVLKEVINEIGHFPTRDELNQMGNGSVSAAIGAHFGGMHEARIKMGFEQKRRKNGYWQNPKNILDEARNFLSENPEYEILPGDKVLRRLGQSPLAAAKCFYPGGARQLREDLGEQSAIRPVGYWKDFDNVKKALGKLESQLGHFPVERELRELKYNGLASAISEYHGGIISVKEKMGFSTTRVPNGHWKDFGNVESKLLEICDELGHFPTHEELYDSGNGGLSQSLHQYGGIWAVRKRMGYAEDDELESLLENYGGRDE